MNGMLKAVAICSLLAGGLWGVACSSDESTDHDQNLGGVLHRAGYTDPRSAGCPTCHGTDLRGGHGPSCYTCHDTVNI